MKMSYKSRVGVFITLSLLFVIFISYSSFHGNGTEISSGSDEEIPWIYKSDAVNRKKISFEIDLHKYFSPNIVIMRKLIRSSCGCNEFKLYGEEFTETCIPSVGTPCLLTVSFSPQNSPGKHVNTIEFNPNEKTPVRVSYPYTVIDDIVPAKSAVIISQKIAPCIFNIDILHKDESIKIGCQQSVNFKCNIDHSATTKLRNMHRTTFTIAVSVTDYPKAISHTLIVLNIEKDGVKYTSEIPCKILPDIFFEDSSITFGTVHAVDQPKRIAILYSIAELSDFSPVSTSNGELFVIDKIAKVGSGYDGQYIKYAVTVSLRTEFKKSGVQRDTVIAKCGPHIGNMEVIVNIRSEQ